MNESQVSKGAEFRKRAEECHQLAAAVLDPRAKAFWLRSAEDWMIVAAVSEKLVDQRENRHSEAA
jgi:hypothetical protein